MNEGISLRYVEESMNISYYIVQFMNLRIYTYNSFFQSKRGFQLGLHDPTSTCLFKNLGKKGNKEGWAATSSVSNSQPQEKQNCCIQYF